MMKRISCKNCIKCDCSYETIEYCLHRGESQRNVPGFKNSKFPLKYSLWQPFKIFTESILILKDEDFEI